MALAHRISAYLMSYSHISGSEGRLSKKADLGSFYVPAFHSKNIFEFADVD